MPRFLSIDQSTSATKAILLDESGQILGRASKNHAQSYPQPGYVEQDASEIFRNTLEVLGTVLDAQDDDQSITAVSISNQRETVVVFDRDSGEPLHPAIVWQCRRGTDVCEELKRQGSGKTVHERTGLALDPYFSASKLHVLLQDKPELRQLMEDGKALIGTMDTFLIHRLTGGRVFATDHTNACRTLLYNIRKRAWDGALCDLWGIPRQALPEIRDCSERFGTVSAVSRLEGVPICGVMGDSHASLFAQQCFRPGMTKVTLGTGSSILMNTGPEPAFQENGVLSTLAWVHQGKATYANEGIIVSSASTLEWLKTRLGILNDISEAESLATELSSNDGVYLVPAFTGLGLPHWEPRARAAICGLSNHSDRRHIVRAALEAIAYQLKDALEAMVADSSLSLQSIHADGGPTANRFLMQFIADVIGIPVRVSPVPDGSPTGAAMMGMLGMGTVASIGAFSQQDHGQTAFQPAADPETVKAFCSGWHRAVRQTLAG